MKNSVEKTMLNKLNEIDFPMNWMTRAMKRAP